MGNSRYVKVGDLLGPRNIEFLGDVQTDKKGHYGMFKCPDCGQSFISRIDHIKHGSTIRCKNCRVKAQSGDKNPNFKNLTGKRYGKLTVLEDGGIIYVGKKNPTKRRIWKCQCDCGNICYESTNVLERGLVNSCGKCDLHSNGEYAIQQILLNNNIKFENQKKLLQGILDLAQADLDTMNEKTDAEIDTDKKLKESLIKNENILGKKMNEAYAAQVKNDTAAANAKIKNQGLAIFKDDKLIGEISREETLCYMLVSGKLKEAVINVPSPFEDADYVSLNISSVHSKNKVEIKNGTPFITCNISLSARVLSSTKTSNYLSKENSLALEYATNSYLNANITDFLYKTSKELKSDFIGFGRNAVRSFKTMDDWKNYDWLNKYQNSEFNVNVNTTVKSSYLLIG